MWNLRENSKHASVLCSAGGAFSLDDLERLLRHMDLLILASLNESNEVKDLIQRFAADIAPAVDVSTPELK